MRTFWTMPSNIRKVLSVCLALSTTFATTTYGEKSTPVFDYEVYDDVSLSIGVNVDDYIVEDADGKWFRVAKLAYDCGWLGDNTYSAVDSHVEATYTPGVLSYDDGSAQVSLMLDGYHDEIVPGGEDSQLCAVEMSYSTGGEPETMSVYFDRHFSEDEYRIEGYEWYVSRDDMVVLCYILWSESIQPGETPLVTAFGDEYIGADSSEGAIAFSLP